MSCEEFLSREVNVTPTIKMSANEIKSFVERHHSGDRAIVLVTSGGTTVPLEEKTVRYIDNFSVGTRGSTSAEYFLEHGYIVIFLHRRGTLQPFNRFFQHNHFLEMFEADAVDSDAIKLKSKWMSLASSCYKRYKAACDSDSLLNIEFTTLSEYLYLLQVSAKHLGRCEGNAMLYLAAAVSDFYIPETKMAPHKIQSSDGPLQLSLNIVPKFLEPLVRFLVPRAFVVSFKLETDPGLLLTKSKKALDAYNHQVVIGNVLETRKSEVVVVTKETEKWLKLDDCIQRRDGEGERATSGEMMEIERVIVAELVDMHRVHLSQTQSR